MSGLRKTVVPVSFAQGVDTKTDPYQLTTGKLALLQNAVFTSPKEITKRNGYNSLSQNILGGGTISSAVALMGYEQGLLLADGLNLYNYSAANSEWSNLGPMETTGSITQSKIVVPGATDSVTGYDAAIHSSGLQVAVYELDFVASGGIFYTAIDTTTGTTVIPPTQIFAVSAPRCPKVVMCGTNAIVTFIDSGVLYAFTIGVFTLTASGPVATPLTSATGATQLCASASLQQYDICVSRSGAHAGIYVAFNNNVAGGSRGYTVIFCTQASPLAISLTSGNAIGALPTCICVFIDQYTLGPVVGYGTSSEVAFNAIKPDLSGSYSGGPVILDGLSVRNITGVSTNADAAGFTFAYTSSNNTTLYTDYVLQNTVNASYVASLATTAMPSVSLTGKAFLSSTGRVLVPVVFDSAQYYSYTNLPLTIGSAGYQSTNFLIDLALPGKSGTSNQVARYAAGASLGRYQNAIGATYSMLPESTAYGANFLLPQAVAYELNVSNGVPQPLFGLSAFTYTPSPGYVARAQLANTMLIGGSYVFSADAAGVPVEHFFAYGPWITNMAPAGGGVMTPGATYQFIATYEWTDANGQTQVSVPGAAASFTLGKASSTVTLSGVGAGNTLNVNGTPFLAVASGAGALQFNVQGPGDQGTATNLAAAINNAAITGVVVQTPVTGTNVFTIINTASVTLTITGSGSFAIASTGAQTEVVVTAPLPSVTAKTGTRGAILTGIYRTTGNGLTFYREGYTTTGTFTCGASIPDAAVYPGGPSIIGLTPLYTQPNVAGAVFENDTPPPTQAMIAHRNRIFLVDSTDPLSIWYSKPIIHTPGTPSNNPVQFSAYQIIIASEQGGGVTALGSLDDKLVVFKQDRIFVVTGQGPTANGSNNDFSDTIQVTVDCGAISQASIVTMPHGLMFQSLKGIYLLGRDLSVSYIGAPVEDYTNPAIAGPGAYLVTSAQLVADTNQVRFTMSGGIALVFDYLVGQWSVFTNVSAIDSAVAGSIASVSAGGYVFVTPSGVVNRELPSIDSHLDGIAFIPMTATTGWISLAGLQGFQRIYKILVLGYSGGGSVSTSTTIGYDFGANTQTATESISAGASGQYQWRIFTSQQKCEAIQISVSDTATLDTGGALQFSGFALEVGLKYGAFKLPAAQSTG